MCEAARFLVDQPALTVALVLLLPLALLYPAWVLGQIPGQWHRRLAFLATPPGLPAALILLLFLIAEGLALTRAYGGYWAIHLDRSGRIELDYLWPRPSVGLDPTDLRHILATSERYKMRGGDAERLSLNLETQDGQRYRSVHLPASGQLGPIVQALATCTGAPVRSATQRGLFGQPEPIAD